MFAYKARYYRIRRFFGIPYYCEKIRQLRRNHYRLGILLIIGFLGGFIAGDLKLFIVKNDEVNSISFVKDIFVKDSVGRSVQSIHQKHYTEPIEIIGKLSTIRAKLERQLREDYGDYFASIFDEKMMSKIFRVNEKSKERITRRVMMKVMAYILEPTVDVTLTWATGGDSAAAGHGNLFSQSYTAVMEDTVREAFAASGIKFVAKKHAMGDYPSAPELAMCIPSIYGTDIDILSWDFSLTDDEKTDHRLSLWTHRAATHPTKPLLFVMDTSESQRYDRHVAPLEEHGGIGAVLMDRVGLSLVKTTLPDAMLDGDGHVPEALRNFICGGFSEGAYPCDDEGSRHVCSPKGNSSICVVEKFDTRPYCEEARYQTSWNPGWKEHFLKGRLLGYFMINALHDSLVQLDQLRRVEGQINLEDMYNELALKEIHDRELFFKSSHTVEWTDRDKDVLRYITPETLSRNHAVCHTALLPSHSRYQNIVTEISTSSSSSSSSLVTTNEYPPDSYDKGISKNEYIPAAETAAADLRKVPLVYDPQHRQSCQQLEIDYKDYFYVPATAGWLHMTIPTPSERKAYGPLTHTRQEQHNNKAYILVCWKICPVGDDPTCTTRRNVNVMLKVNGKRVINVKNLGSCQFLEGKDGLAWMLDKNGQFHLNFHIKSSSRHWMKISSVIVLSERMTAKMYEEDVPLRDIIDVQ